MNKGYSPKRLLIIDDDPTYGRMVVGAARSRGIEAEHYMSLLELGSFARICEFDIAVLDFYLDNFRGDEIAQYVETFFCDMPVVIVSVHQFADQSMDNWPECIRRFIPKQQGLTALIDQVSDVLQRDHLIKRLNTPAKFRESSSMTSA